MTITEKPDWPEKKWKRAGDETYCICKLDNRYCKDEYGYSCSYYKEYLEEQDE